MAYRPPYGYNPGGLQPSQQQHPVPGQMMHPPQQYPGVGMVQQGYHMPGQPGLVMAPGVAPGMALGVAPGMARGMAPGMAPGMYYPNQQAMVQQGFIPAGMAVPGGAVPQQQQVAQPPQKPLTEEERRAEEKMKKERYFREQKEKLKQFGKGSKPGLSLDMASSLVDSLGGPSKTNTQAKPSHQPLPRQAVEGESFGDFQQAGSAGTDQGTEEDDFGDFLQARSDVTSSTPVATEVKPPTANPPSSQQTTSVPTPQKALTPPPPHDIPPVPKKEEISLEDMMKMSTDLSDATKLAKPIHIKKTLNEVKGHQPANKTAAVFSASSKSRTWSSGGDEFSTLFTTESPGVLPEVPPGSTDGVIGVKGAAGQSPNSMPIWLTDLSKLPLVYRQVYEATFLNGSIQTQALYPILLMSGLERPVLGQIWNMVNKTQSGVLDQQELFQALGLIALHQNKLPVTLEYLMALQEAPLPNLTPQQAAPPTATTTPHQPPVTSTIQPPPVVSGPVTKDPSPDDVISFSQSVAKEKETFDQFDREEENCYIFTTSPVASSSGHSSPVLWDQNSIYDKLRSRSRESLSSSSVNSDHMGDEQIAISQFKRHQPEGPPKDSLEEEFADFQSSRIPANPAQPTPFISIPAPPGAPYQFKMMASAPRPTKSATSPNLKSLSDNSSDVDLEFGDFSSHRAVQQSVPAGQLSFGNMPSSTSSGTNEQWATFQHASSEPSLMSNEAEDKYAAFKVLAVPEPEGSLFSNTSSPTPRPTGADSDDDCGSALRGMVSESDDEEPFANFQSASIPPEIFQQGLVAPIAPGGGLFASPTPTADSSDDFGDFIAPQESKADEPVADMFGDFSQFKSSSGGTNLPSSITFPPSKQGEGSSSLPPLGMLGSTSLTFPLPTKQESELPGALGQPPNDPKQSNLNLPPSTSKGFGNFDISSEGSAGAMDRYEAFKSLQLTLSEDRQEEDDFGDFHAVEPSQNSVNSLNFDGIQPADPPNKNSVPNFMDDSLNGIDFQNNNADEVIKPPPLHPGLDGPPLLLPDTLGGDRYSEVAGDKLDENRHITAWERCLTSCHSAIKVANDVLNNISSSSVCKEVTTSRSGSEYFKAIIEVYRVACRVFASIKARGVETDSLMKLNSDIEKTWTNLAAFLSATSLQIDNGSFVFKTATLKPDPDNQEKACGVCLLNVDSRSKAYNRTEDSHKLNYGGRQYHATCANLWVNMVDSLLPALPLEALL